MINIKNITIKSNNNYILNNLSFTLNKGDCLGVIGLSGCGKSTLAKALLNIIDDNLEVINNEIYINGVLFDNSMRGKVISLLFQNPNSYLNPLITVGKQISEMLIYHKNMNKKDAKRETINFMKNFSLSEEIYDYYPFELSGGMQQKICLCICLICNPDILVLDECTSYLDANSKRNILDFIFKLQKENHFTIIMISHDFKEIYKYCNKIAVMKKGEIIEFGDKNEIILDPYHNHTIELLSIYLSFYRNIPVLKENIDRNDCSRITHINDSHYFKGSFNKEIKDSYIKIKEEVYEHIKD